MIRYKKLGYIALNVKEIQRSVAYYRDVVGLEVVGEVTEERAFLSCSDDHHNIILYQSDQPGVERVGFEVESAEQIDAGYEWLSEQGYKPSLLDEATCIDLKENQAMRIQDPNGLSIEFYHGMMQLTPRRTKEKPSLINILRLGHIVLLVPNFFDTLKFYTDVMNFRVSDYKGKSPGETNFVFMRCFPNPFHHSFAIASSDEVKVSHVAFMVEDIDDIGRARNKVKKHDVPVAKDIGRHEASSSIFFYFKDPDGMMTEFTLGMEEFPETNPREPRFLEDTLGTSDYWTIFE